MWIGILACSDGALICMLPPDTNGDWEFPLLICSNGVLMGLLVPATLPESRVNGDSRLFKCQDLLGIGIFPRSKGAFVGLLVPATPPESQGV